MGGGTTSIDKAELKNHALTVDEKKGLRYTAIAAIAFVVVLLILVIPESSLFRNADGGLLPKSPLLSSIVSILFFLLFYISYGLWKRFW